MASSLIRAMASAIGQLKQWPDRRVQLFHHNDADGLTSGAILTRAFERAAFPVERLCLEKPYPALLDTVFRQKGRLIVFADFAGRIAPLISRLNGGRNLVLILDHHKAEPAVDPMVHNLDAELHGLRGDRDITASTTCYLFATTLDPGNRDLAAAAAIGAVGDGFFVGGRLAGPNREVALEAARQGKLEIKAVENGGEDYLFATYRGPVDGRELSADLDTLGAAGYHRNGPAVGIGMCLEGFSATAKTMLVELRAVRERLFAAEIARLSRGGLRQSQRIQWFHVENRFAPMGVKMIGTFCQTYKDSEVFDPAKYIAGFQVIPDDIPNFGPLPMNQVKISMRVSAPMQEAVRAGRVPGLDSFLPEATGRLGGFSDACHSLAAATTVAVGCEAALIGEMETILEKQLGKVVP